MPAQFRGGHSCIGDFLCCPYILGQPGVYAADRMVLFGPGLFPLFQKRLQIHAGKGIFIFCNLFRRALCHNAAAFTAAFRAKVDDMICALNDVEVVLYYNYGIAGVHQCVQYFYQLVHVGHMQAGGGFVQDVHRLSRAAARQLQRELYALRLAA